MNIELIPFCCNTQGDMFRGTLELSITMCKDVGFVCVATEISKVSVNKLLVA